MPCSHPKVRAISFVGSSAVAKHIYETGTRHGRRVQANGGAKNYIVIMPDADVPRTVEALATAAFGCAGERCMAGSTALTVGRGGRSSVTLVSQSSARIAGAPNEFYIGATIVDRVEDEMTIAREEVFGPVLNVMRMEDLDHAIAMANKSSYGNGAAIFTNSGKAAREFKHRVKAGMVGINVGVPATMAMFPFTGWDNSFNGDLHIQGKEGVQFYTQQKVVSARWFGEGVGDVWQK